MGNKKRFYAEDVKRRAVEDYVSGRRTAADLASELGVAPGLIYKWKVKFDEQAKGERIDDLQSQGIDPASARRILELETELSEYQKKVGQQAVLIDLLKKLQPPSSPLANVSNGLTDIIRHVARSKRRAL